MDKDLPELWKHQRDAIERARGKPQYALLMDPGVGKTRTLLEIYRDLCNRDRHFYRTLIVTPLITFRNWVNEINRYTKIELYNVGILEGSQKQRCEILAKQFLSGDKRIAVVNYEALATMTNLVEGLVKWAPEVLVADEMHKIKSPSAKAHKAVVRLGDQAKYRYGLTGTPILRSPMDIFGQWRFLDRGKTFGQNFFVFRGKYFYDKNAGMPKHNHFPNWQPRPGVLQEFEQLMAEHSSVARKEDVLDLPPLVRTKVMVELSAKQRSNYDELKEELITWLHNHEGTEPIVVSTALVKMLRLLQITSGFISDGTTETSYVDNPKADALDELLDTILPNKVIIWACFIKDYEAIRKVVVRHKVKYVECHGGISNNKKFEAVELFTKNPEVQVFIGHPASLGIGINLVEAKYMIYFSRSYSLGDDIQSEARNYRGGSEVHDCVTRYDLVAANTVDELVLNALQSKKEIGIELIQRLSVD